MRQRELPRARRGRIGIGAVHRAQHVALLLLRNHGVAREPGHERLDHAVRVEVVVVGHGELRGGVAETGRHDGRLEGTGHGRVGGARVAVLHVLVHQPVRRDEAALGARQVGSREHRDSREDVVAHEARAVLQRALPLVDALRRRNGLAGLPVARGLLRDAGVSAVGHALPCPQRLRHVERHGVEQRDVVVAHLRIERLLQQRHLRRHGLVVGRDLGAQCLDVLQDLTDVRRVARQARLPGIDVRHAVLVLGEGLVAVLERIGGADGRCRGYRDSTGGKKCGRDAKRATGEG